MKDLHLLILLSVPGLASAISPSFDCSRATTTIEKLICDDDRLADLDRQMASVWRQAQRALPAADRGKQQIAQRRWLEARDDCELEKDDQRGCVSHWYRRRLTELEIISGQIVVPEPVNYRCDGGPYDSLTVYFHDRTPMRAAVLNRINGRLDEQDLAYLGEGEAKPTYYGRHAIMYPTEQGMEGTWDEQPLHCTKLKRQGSE